MSTYRHVVDLDERGSYLASVRDEADRTVFEIRAGAELGEDETSIFDDGFMRHRDDMDGLTEYLVHLGIIPAGSEIVNKG